MPEPATPTPTTGSLINNAIALNTTNQTSPTSTAATIADLAPISVAQYSLSVPLTAFVFTNRIYGYVQYTKTSLFARMLPIGDLSEISKQRQQMRQKVVVIAEDGHPRETEVAFLAPVAIGQMIELSFSVTGDSWQDPYSKLLYLKPNGKTIGKTASGSDYARDDLWYLFSRFHGDSSLQLLDSNNTVVAKTNPSNDWQLNRRLRLPLVQTNKLIFTGVSA